MVLATRDDGQRFFLKTSSCPDAWTSIDSYLCADCMCAIPPPLGECPVHSQVTDGWCVNLFVMGSSKPKRRDWSGYGELPCSERRLAQILRSGQ